MSNPNPYSPPPLQDNQKANATSQRFSGIGVFSDRGTLVLARNGCRMPDLCLKSGEPTTERYRLAARVLPKSKRVTFAVLGGVIGYQIATSIWGQNFSLEIPFRANWNDPSGKKSKRGWRIVWLGLALVILGIVLSIFSEAMIALCGIGLIVGVIGLILGGVKSAAPFVISNFNEQYVWIEGANKTIVGMFEPLPNA